MEDGGVRFPLGPLGETGLGSGTKLERYRETELSLGPLGPTSIGALSLQAQGKAISVPGLALKANKCLGSNFEMRATW